MRVPKGETSRITLKVARDVNYLTVRVTPSDSPVAPTCSSQKYVCVVLQRFCELVSVGQGVSCK